MDKVTRSEPCDGAATSLSEVEDALTALCDAIGDVGSAQEQLTSAQQQLAETQELARERFTAALSALTRCPQITIDASAAIRSAGLVVT